MPGHHALWPTTMQPSQKTLLFRYLFKNYIHATTKVFLEIVSNKVCGNLNKISDALEHFQKLDFTHRISGNLGEVSYGLNNLADIINQMLVENKENGLTLQDSSTTLLRNVDNLSSASNQAAACGCAYHHALPEPHVRDHACAPAPLLAR